MYLYINTCNVKNEAMKSQAVVFNQPRQLSVQSLDLAEMAEGQIQVAVEYSGISTGTERLLWDGSMPPFPGMGYPLVPGYETVGRVVRTLGDVPLAIGDRVFVPGSYSFEGVHNLFGGAGQRLVVPAARVVRVNEPGAQASGADAVLLALAATAYHSVTFGGTEVAVVTGGDLFQSLYEAFEVAIGGVTGFFGDTIPV